MMGPKASYARDDYTGPEWHGNTGKTSTLAINRPIQRQRPKAGNLAHRTGFGGNRWYGGNQPRTQ